MSSRNQIDSVIDDDDESCPLCIEEFDLSDKNFKPCPCGYQICQFCYNNIKTHSEEGRCPNCRRVYDESTIQYKVPDAEEFKADLALKNRKAAAAKKKEAEKRELEHSSRKNLAGVRVVQKNLVYIIGLNPSIRDESQLLQTLRGRDYFGQYGDIEKIVVSKAKPGGNPNQGIGVYVTFASKADAATCIAAVDGSLNGDRVLRAQYGTTKYCSSFLRNEQCNNRNCTFLHETGDDNDSYSRQDLSSMNTAQRHGYSNGNPLGVASQHRPLPHPIHSSQTLRRQASKEDDGANRIGSDGSALPSSASWANRDSPLNRARRVSLSESRSTPSPKTAHATVATGKSSEKQPAPPQEATSQRSTPAPRPGTASASQQTPPPPSPIEDTLLDNLLRAINSPSFRFVFSTAGLSSEDLKSLEVHPSFIDPYGGVKRRAMREKAEQERAKQEAEAQALLQQEESSRESGSLQLGGEPDDNHPSQVGTAGRSRESHGAIQPPSQQETAASSAIGSPVSASHQFQNLSLNQRSLTPLQQQQMLLLKSANNGGQGGLMDPFPSHLGSTGLDQQLQGRQGAFSGHMPQGGMPGHTRQSSRFSFASDSNAKSNTNPRMLGQMQSGTPNPLNVPTSQAGLGNNHFYTSSVQGPPPGLKTAGTPPISGGGMFAQGHGFTSNTNLGLNMGKQDNPELMRELLRGRSGTSGAAGIQSHEASKREFMFPFLQQHPTPPPLTPATGLLSSLYGPPSGNFAEPGPQKQKKKGKKHRHANTSSGGGGVDLADPSILQGRMHQVGANAAAGQGLYGSQTQVDEEFPPLGAPLGEKADFPFRPFLPHDPRSEAFRSGTPTLPPGLPLPHGHPAAALLQDDSNPQSPVSTTSFATRSAAAGVSRHGTPCSKGPDASSRKHSLAAQEPPTTSEPISRPKNFADISLGSPKKRTHKMPNVETESEELIAAEVPAATTEKENLNKEERLPVKNTKPTKLTIPTAAVLESSARTKGEPSTSSQTAGAGAGSTTTQARDSRPNTPLTGSDFSAPRQPRVLRVVETPKTETPPPPSAAPSSVSSATAAKVLARRLSASSFSRPATPADLGSDYEPGTSASVSRANSPPPSRVGSAPIRTVTKSQAKKDRKLKAKQVEAKKEESAVPTSTEEIVQAPIVGRKRKTKKTPATVQSETTTTAPSSPKEKPKAVEVAEPVAAAEKEEPKSDADKKAKSKKTIEEPKPAPVEEKEATPSVEKPAAEEAWKKNNTLEQLIHDAEAMNTSIKDLFLERTSPLQVLLSQLHKAGDLDLNTHPLFNPPHLSQRTDMKCTESDYVALKFPIELGEEHRQTLLRGEPVRLNLKSGQLKGRCLITPRGSVLRHLSAEEEARYLALEKSLGGLKDMLHEYPAASVTEPDATNRAGDLDALFVTPDKFNIRWVTDNPLAGLSGIRGQTTENGSSSTPSSSSNAPPNVFSAIEADTIRNHNWAIANAAELVNATAASVRDFAEATAKHMLGAAAGGPTPTGAPNAFDMVPDLKEVQAMSDEELRTLFERSQRELEQSRKEFDVVDKKLIALVKRNKKLAQQAMATV